MTPIFELEDTCNLWSVASDYAKWALDDRVKPTVNSRVLILSSLKADILLTKFLEINLRKALRLLGEISSSFDNWGTGTSCSQYKPSDPSLAVRLTISWSWVATDLTANRTCMKYDKIGGYCTRAQQRTLKPVFRSGEAEKLCPYSKVLWHLGM